MSDANTINSTDHLAALPVGEDMPRPSTQGKTTEPPEIRFRELAQKWLTETEYLSSTTATIAHPAFQEIVRMGDVVIPLVLREMEKRSGHWDLALGQITGERPFPPTRRGEDAPDRGRLVTLGQGERVHLVSHPLERVPCSTSQQFGDCLLAPRAVSSPLLIPPTPRIPGAMRC